MGGADIRTVLFPADDEDGTPHTAHSAAEIQLLHGIAQDKRALFIKGHGVKNGSGQKAENQVLDTERRLGNFMRRPDQDQRFYLFGEVQRIVQRQDTAQ